MKTIIAGSRSIIDLDEVYSAIKDSGFSITEVVSGKARGVDSLGEWWAKDHNIPIMPFLPDYKKYGRYVAPMMRNQVMADYGEALIAIWDGKSNGTKDMIERAKNRNLKIYVHIIKGD